MKRNPYEYTFEEYLSFHNNVVRNAGQKSTAVSESENESMSDDIVMQSHNPRKSYIDSFEDEFLSEDKLDELSELFEDNKETLEISEIF